MDTLFISKDCKILREDSTLIVTSGSSTRRRVPIEGLRHVIVAGEAQLTTAVLVLCGRSGVRVTILDWHGNVTGSFEPRGASSSGKVRLLQARHVSDHSLRMALARSFVAGAGANILANLRYRLWRGNDALAPVVGHIESIIGKLPQAVSVESLMGMEGQMRAFYYDAWPVIDARLDFGKRRRRPPDNPLNALISWFNGLAYALVRNEIAKTHLDDSLAFLHSAQEARSSLALDIAEIFKPAVCDTLIFEFVRRDQLDEAWFHQEDGVCRLSKAGRQATLERWVRKVEDRGADGTLRELIRAEALAVERHLLGIEAYKPWKRKV
jgi:CRISPR-associated protein Cas1